MGWFEEQIRQRRLQDQRAFQEGFASIAGAVLGRRAAPGDESQRARSAIEEVLRYYHAKSREVPDSVKDFNEQLEFLLRPYGIMRRTVTLEKGWYRDAMGAMLTRRKSDGALVAMIPTGLSGYTYLEPETGKRRRINARTEEPFEKEAIAFYKPFPQGKIGIPGLMKYIASCTSLADWILFAASALAVSLVGLLLPWLNKLLFSRVATGGSVTVLAALVIVGVTLGFSVLTTFRQRGVTQQMMEQSARENGLTYAPISGVQKVKLSGAEKRAFAKWSGQNAKGTRLRYDPPMFLKVNSVISLAITLAGTLVMYVVAVRSGVSAAEYYAFNSAYAMLSGAFMSLVGIAVMVGQIIPILNMAKPILEAEPEIAEDKQVVERLSGGIELNNVSFRYAEDMPSVVDNLSLKIRPGQYVTIVGKTGCGKSTLMRLLLGFETPQKGAIYYDGRDMAALDLRSLRRRMGVVMQDGKLFQGDIYSNITISAPWLTVDDAWAAAKMAGVAEDIRRMPMGMHTLISEGGGISGGQRQRLLIARNSFFAELVARQRLDTESTAGGR